MKRRQFIGSALAAAGSSAFAQRPNQSKLDRVAIMSLCFSPLLRNKTLELMDLPAMIAERYGVHYVEMQHSHFESTELQYFEQFKDRMKKAKSRMNQINVEFGPLNISATDPVLRLENIDLTKRWIDHAQVLGCPRVMVNQGTLASEVRADAIETLKKINAYAKTKKVFITMENRGGRPVAGAPPRPGWDVVVEVIKAAGIWANPDVGNFPDEEARAAGLRAMYPLSSGSSHCHYDPERYSEAAAIAISKEVGYKGLYSIEAVASNGPDPYAAVQTILDELLKDI
jgi:sugar phosphate isomerase/epimerase